MGLPLVGNKISFATNGSAQPKASARNEVAAPRVVGSSGRTVVKQILRLQTNLRGRCIHVLKIEAPDAVSRYSFAPGTLPPSWPDNQGLTQGMANIGLEPVTSCLLEVPSVLLPATWNVLINPLHPDFKLLKIVEVYNHPYDPRLF